MAWHTHLTKVTFRDRDEVRIVGGVWYLVDVFAEIKDAIRPSKLTLAYQARDHWPRRGPRASIFIRSSNKS